MDAQRLELPRAPGQALPAAPEAGPAAAAQQQPEVAPATEEQLAALPSVTQTAEQQPVAKAEPERVLVAA